MIVTECINKTPFFRKKVCTIIAILFRYENYPIGTKEEHTIVAYANCCVPQISLKISDVAGNVAAKIAHWDGTQSVLSKETLYAIIGGSVGAILIILIVALAIYFRNAYSPVSGNDH